MTRSNQEVGAPWPTSQWLGEGASAQWTLWQAGIEWATISNSLLSAPAAPFPNDSSSQSPSEILKQLLPRKNELDK